MSLLTQLLIVACYAILALVAGVILSQSVAELPPYMAYGAAAVGFVVAVLSHEMIQRRRDARSHADALEGALDELDALRHLSRDLKADIGQTRSEMSQLCDVLESASSGSNQDLVRELNMLQAQLGRFSEQRVDGGEPSPPLELEDIVLEGEAEVPVLELSDVSEIEPEATGPGSEAAPEAAAAEPPPAKATGRRGGLPALRRRDRGILTEAREALASNRIDLYLQPVVSLPQRKVRYYEAFSRLRTREGRVLTPDQYLDYAENAGLISTIDNLLLFRCVQLTRRHNRRRRPVAFFINISSHTLHDTDFLQQFADFLEGNRNLANSLVFEFGQPDVAAFPPPVRQYLARLARRGFRFSMDQVSTLDLDAVALEAMGFAFVKVPAALMLDGQGGRGARVHPHDLKEMLSRSDIDLVAEKIETERQVVEILDLKVDFGQGYLFGQPRQAREESEAA